MNDATAAVVIPNWNGLAHLRECLASVASPDSDAQIREVIVVDNGSSDGSAGMVRADFPTVRLILNDTNRGFAAACNQGAQATSATHVAFLNNDARVDGGWLAPLADVLATEPDVAAVGSLVLDWDGKNIDFGRSGLTPLARGIQLDFGIPVSEAPTERSEQLFANGAAMLVRRELFLELGGFDDRFFAYYEDVDLGWRYWLLGWRVLLEPASRVFHRHHGTSGRLRQEQVDFLLTRNAFITAAKNVDDQTFASLVPILLLEQAAQMAGELGSPQSLYVSGFAKSAYRQRDALRLPDRARQRLGSEARRLYQKDARLGTRLARSIARVLAPRSALIDTRAQAGVAALDDVLWGWPEILRQRAGIQSKRKRSDREIADLFGLDSQRRHRRRDAMSPDQTRGAVFRALDAADLGWLLPRG